MFDGWAIGLHLIGRIDRFGRHTIMIAFFFNLSACWMRFSIIYSESYINRAIDTRLYFKGILDWCDLVISLVIAPTHHMVHSELRRLIVEPRLTCLRLAMSESRMENDSPDISYGVQKWPLRAACHYGSVIVRVHESVSSLGTDCMRIMIHLTNTIGPTHKRDRVLCARW
jgi:hypothetical protein